MFIDEARIFVEAGDGGNGCMSFNRTRQISRGKPDGGDGGDGGNVIIKTSRHIQTLLDFRYNRHFSAERGTHGSSNHKAGRNGKDLIVHMPCGTVLKDARNGMILRDLVEPDSSVVIAKGGKGGKGNSRFRPSTPGEPGEEKEICLELKLIADVGIIGCPNAGKSTFISKVSSAKSKIADYPFTTKCPILGIVRFDDKVLTFADMPGLIEGAHLGRGLGDRFLRHIERTRILLHIVDAVKIEGGDPYEDYLAIENELKSYESGLAGKHSVIALNKIDLPGALENIEKFEKRLPDKKIFPISGVTGEGVKKLLSYIFSVA